MQRRADSLSMQPSSTSLQSYSADAYDSMCHGTRMHWTIVDWHCLLTFAPVASHRIVVCSCAAQSCTRRFGQTQCGCLRTAGKPPACRCIDIASPFCVWSSDACVSTPASKVAYPYDVVCATLESSAVVSGRKSWGTGVPRGGC